jgi:murein L,D-transpeptidase YcbB/YkuD
MNRTILFILIIIFIPGFIYAQNSIPDLIKSNLEQISNNKEATIAGEKLHSIEFVVNLYSRNDFQPFWTESESLEDAIRSINSSYEDGLLPQDYHLEAILALKHDIGLAQINKDEKKEKLAELDLLLTDGIIFFADHLLYGKIDPVSLVPTWNFGFAPIPDLNPTTFSQYINNHEIFTRLQNLRPELRQYDTLIVILAKYRAIAEKGGWESIPSGGKIEPGKRDSRIPSIRKRLQITGELTIPDSVGADLYDKSLEKDIKSFQSAHALDTDGVIGIGTFRELNVPLDQRIASLRVNLERFRWVSRNMPEKYIIVNIAGFWLEMISNKQLIHYAAVVVGKPLNETPLFRDKLRYIEFNPSWMLPTSIIDKEIIPILKRDTAYLNENHMVLLDSKGNIVPTSMLNKKDLTPSRFPYLIRQEPGPWNALGAMKFMFPNEYDVYLHDTPSKYLFSKASRAFSHGCIRLDKPEDLAVKLLAGTEYDRAKIDQIVETQITTRVNLPEPVDIMLMYWTCGIDKDGKLFFVPDIYDHDQDILTDLDKPMR